MRGKLRRTTKFFWSFFVIFLSIFICVPILAMAADSNFDMYYQDVISDVQSGESVVYRLNLRVKGIVNDATKQRKVVITLPGAKEGLTEFDKGSYGTVEEKLKAMAIEDVVPTLEETPDGKQIVYDFKNTLRIGATYSVEIPLKTGNGIIKNKQVLYPRAEYYENGTKIFDRQPSKGTQISSHTAADISKQFVGVQGFEYDEASGVAGSHTPRNGDTVIWKIKATIPYEKIGQAFIKEGSKIVITDKIEGNYHEFVSAEANGQFKNGVVTWTFDAPSIAEQRQRASRAGGNNLWEVEFKVRTKAKDVKLSATIHNKAKIVIQNISDESSSYESNDVSLLVVSGNDGVTPSSQQGFMQGLVAGPADDKGTVISNVNEYQDRRIQVPSGAYLGFAMFYRISPSARIIQYSNGKREYIADKGELPYVATYDKDGYRTLTPTNYPTEEIANVEYWNGYRRIFLKREVDPNLVLEDIEIGVPVRWARLNADGTPADYQEFGKLPEVNIKLTVTDDKNNLSVVYVPVVYRNLKPDPFKWGAKNGDSSSPGVPLQVMKLTRQDFKQLKDFARVVSYEVEFRPADDDNRDDDFTKGQKVIPGDFFVNVYDHYTVKPGATGTFQNKAEYTLQVLRWHRWNKEYTEFVRAEDPARPAGAMGARTVIVNPDINYNTSINVNAELEKRDGNVVNVGDNILKFTMKANYPTPANAVPNASATLLPIGMTVDTTKSRGWQYLEPDGTVIESSPDQIEVIDNFNNTGRQLVRVRWQNKVLSANRSLEVRVPVKVSNTMNKQVEIPVYGTVDNKDFTVIKPNEKVQDEMDINEKNGTTDKMATNLTRYVLVNRNELKIEKAVRGDIDKAYAEALTALQQDANNKDKQTAVNKMQRVQAAFQSLKGTPDQQQFSKFGVTSFGGIVEYKLKMTNTTGEKITKMGFMDQLPHPGDWGIVNNTNARGSKFTPTLTGPVQVPSSWKNKVEVYYSEATNPDMQDFNNKIDTDEAHGWAGYIPSPGDWQQPNWTSESQVSNWSTIRSFKIELKSGVEWIEGQNIELLFTMKVPEDRNFMTRVPSSDADRNTIVNNKSAWNTFAVTTNGSLPVEPERVGVAYLEPLHVKVRKVDQFGNPLTKGTVDYKFWIDAIEGNPGGMWYTRDGQNIELSNNNPMTFEKIDRFSTARTSNTYWITEERAPAGYKKTENRYKVVLNGASRTVTLVSIQNGPNGKEEVKNTILYDELDPNLQGDKEKTVDVVNHQQLLPKTGGHGAILYILIGGILIYGSQKLKNKKE